MERKKPEEQKEHDSMILSLEKVLVSKGLTVRTNKGTSKNHAVTRGSDYEFYPDLYVYDGDNVTEIYEVETNESVTEKEAEDQWLPYSQGSSKFFLVVPKDKLVKAKELVSKFKIKVDNIYTF